MDHGPSFGAVQSRLLRGYPLLHADRTGLVHRTQLQTPSHKSLSLKRISLLALLEPSDLSVRAYLTPLGLSEGRVLRRCCSKEGTRSPLL